MMVIEDDDDEYMANLSRFIPNESRPAPSHGRIMMRQAVAKDKRHFKEKRKVTHEQQKKLEGEQRQAGLDSAIPSTNIGFKMLQQMGYTPGAALGKYGQGLLEPVNVDLKRSRTGLGRDIAVKEEERTKAVWADLEKLRNRRREEELKVDFREWRKGSWQMRKITSDYRKAHATLAQLEEKSSSSVLAKQSGTVNSSPNGRVKGEFDDTRETNDAVEEEEEEITVEILQETLQKLRSKYNYCLYCGFQYDSAATLLADCPGLEEDVH